MTMYIIKYTSKSKYTVRAGLQPDTKNILPHLPCATVHLILHYEHTIEFTRMTFISFANIVKDFTITAARITPEKCKISYFLPIHFKFLWTLNILLATLTPFCFDVIYSKVIKKIHQECLMSYFQERCV